MKFEKILKDDWYIQGFPAVPIFLNLTGYSGFIFNLKFSHFLTRYQKGYGEMGYFNPDFLKMWQQIKPKLYSNQKYLTSQKNKYKKDLVKYQKLYKKIDQTNLSKVTNQELIRFLNDCAWGQIYSGGIAHPIIEPISLEIEKEFKNNLLEHLGPISQFNKYYSNLTTPTQLSWISQEEIELKKITKKTDLKKHLKKYFWIKNSYNEAKTLNLDILSHHWEKIKSEKINLKTPIEIKQDKDALIKKLSLTSELKKQIKIIDFISIWQDERKANIFLAIDYLDKILIEISKRIKINKKYLHYLSNAEALHSRSLSKIKSLKSELIKREKGCYFYITPEQEKIFTGAQYKKMLALKEELEKEKTNIEDALHGSVANTGTAMGRAVVVKNISQLNKVQEGDVLVASMTRPEFMPAIKKACALVTDEGGITCHAAIVSRELGKPCIIGTKVATKVLKDGMLVEVKANHGIVKIIKQSYTS